METAFFLWPPPPDHRSHGGAAIPPTTRTSRPKKKPAGPKKPPQRGLGVEQLERLRLQENFRKIHQSEHLPAAAPPRPGYSLYHVAALRYPAAIPPPEFPSSQSLRCSEHCELCFRTKRLLGERVGGVEREWDDPMDEGGAEEPKEFMFFPCSSNLGELKSSWEEPIASRAAWIEEDQLDLSLKLSL